MHFRFMLQTWKDVNPNLDLKFLMADASEAVFNAAKTIWPGLVRLMCYAHVFLVRTLFFFTFLYHNSLTQKFALTMFF